MKRSAKSSKTKILLTIHVNARLTNIRNLLPGKIGRPILSKEKKLLLVTPRGNAGRPADPRKLLAFTATCFSFNATASKELEKQQVVTKDGGFIGLGKIEKLKDDFNRDYFEKIDIRKVKRLKLFCAKAKLITTHPANSYKIYGQNRVDSLVITNPNQFWSVSKYLVVVVE